MDTNTLKIKNGQRIKNYKLGMLFLVFSFIVSMTIILYQYYPRYRIKIQIIKVGEEQAEEKIQEMTLLDTSGCKIPKFDPFDTIALPYYEKMPGYLNCTGPPSFLRRFNSNSLMIDEVILKEFYGEVPENINCTYNAIVKDSSDNYDFEYIKPLELKTPIEDEFLKIQCFNKSEYEILTEIIPIIPDKPYLEIILEEKLKASAPPEPLNVLIVGIDAISKQNFIRHFPSTRKYLSEELKALEFNGYNKVGANSFPNLVALLTGRPGIYYENFTYFDDADFIWDHYSSHGYRTLYTEDMTFVGTFNSYGGYGFKTSPVDYYFRPASTAMEAVNKAQKYCYWNKMQIEFYWDYIKSFVDCIRFPKLYFAFTFVTTITHDYLNNAGYVDLPSLSLLKHLKTSGTLNNTILFLFSDHGINYGGLRGTKVGQFEDRLPMGFLVFPEWFYKKYPAIYKNLKINQNRLITLFDVHATLYHFLNFTKAPPTHPPYKYGRSLFSEIPDDRTCEDAGIPQDFCACNLYQPLAINDSQVLIAAENILDKINGILKDDMDICHYLELSEIKSAKSSMDGKNKRFVVVIQTTPGQAVFESLLKYDTRTNAFWPIDTVLRINLYGNTSSCVDTREKKNFCFCKNL